MAGQSMRDIRRRIRSVKSTQQITRAMEMVAAAKLRRAQQQITASQPFTEKLRGILARVMAHGDIRRGVKQLHPLLETREVKRVAYVVVTADRGLAGGYSANILRLAQETMDADEREKLIIVVGRKGRDHYVNRDVPLYSGDMESDYLYIGDDLSFEESRGLTRLVTEAYIEGTVDEINFVHSVFQSTATHVPTVTQLLPIEAEDIAEAETTESADDDTDGEALEPIYEPNAETVLNILIPRYIETQVYSMLLEAKASEQGARMLAMRNATENADEMIEKLVLSFNRARQNSITTELSEIVGGANALAGGE